MGRLAPRMHMHPQKSTTSGRERMERASSYVYTCIFHLPLVGTQKRPELRGKGSFGNAGGKDRQLVQTVTHWYGQCNLSRLYRICKLQAALFPPACFLPNLCEVPTTMPWSLSMEHVLYSHSAKQRPKPGNKSCWRMEKQWGLTQVKG